MNEVQLRLSESGRGKFFIDENSQQLGEMVFDIKGNKLTVYHTEVIPEASDKGLAKKLLDAMVEYVRKEKLQVIPLCAYVHAKFKRNPELYSDIWTTDN